MSIPCCSSRDASRENADEVIPRDSKGSVRQAQAPESNPVDGLDVSDASPNYRVAPHQPQLFIHCQLGDEGICLSPRGFPITSSD